MGETQSSKDFVEHLRAVHFALVAASIGLVVLASFKTTSQITRAHDQVKQILDTLDRWDESILQKRAILAVRSSPSANEVGEELSQYGVRIQQNHRSKNFGIELLRPAWFVDPADLPEKLLKFQPFVDNQGNEIELRQPSTINQFRSLWDSLDSHVRIRWPTIIHDCSGEDTYRDGSVSAPLEYGPAINCAVLFTRPEKPFSTFRFEVKRSPKNGFPSDLERNPEWYYAGYGESMSEDYAGELNIIVPIKAFGSMEISSHDLLPGLNSAWHIGPFEDNFRDLLAVGTALGDSDFRTAERVLAAEEGRSDTAFELAGIKLPAQIAVRWGIVIIITLQLYMLVHLLEFKSRPASGDDHVVAWIGVYASIFARLLLFVSLLLIPSLAVLDLTVSGVRQGFSYAWLAFVVGNSVSIGLTLGLATVLPPRIKATSATSLVPEPPASPPPS